MRARNDTSWATVAVVIVLCAAAIILAALQCSAQPTEPTAAAVTAQSEQAPTVGSTRGHWMYVGSTPAGGQLWLDCWHYGGIYVGPDGTPVPDRALLPTPAEMATCDTLQHDVAFGGPSI